MYTLLYLKIKSTNILSASIKKKTHFLISKTPPHRRSRNAPESRVGYDPGDAAMPTATGGFSITPPCLTTIAMENGPFIDGLPGFTY